MRQPFGTPQPLGDDYYRLAHSDIDGRPVLNAAAAAAGLAAALIIEHSIDAGPVTVDAHGTLTLTGTTPIPNHRDLCRRIAAEPPHPVGDWLAVLALDAATVITNRMHAAGHLAAVRRGLLGRRLEWTPTDMNTAAWPGARLRIAIGTGRPVTLSDRCLIGLAHATDLHRRLLDGQPDAADYLTTLVAGLPAPLHAIVTATRAAAGRAIVGRI